MRINILTGKEWDGSTPSLPSKYSVHEALETFITSQGYERWNIPDNVYNTTHIFEDDPDYYREWGCINLTIEGESQ